VGNKYVDATDSKLVLDLKRSSMMAMRGTSHNVAFKRVNKFVKWFFSYTQDEGRS
jgi:hypothetical protein